MSHRERLLVPWSWVLVALAAVASVAVTCALVLSWPLVLGVTAVVSVLVGLLLWQLSSPVVADAAGLRAGTARIEWRWVAGARSLDAAEVEDRLRGRADVRAWRLQRSYVPGAVRVELCDPADPHPAWLISSRRPEQLAAAIRERLRTEREDDRGEH
ncbi:DUF3093 domain-containing protein [Desertihabitans brevis]|uniref:DUF3093 domain-containing protein n=1 Tax=Desertihabitans brevis TaxID=2268447 RepID=A0A367YZK5_9ACTN|nr:DUF3093 family protein [Desertihabitans brevis]RCK71353.1 DUF3093 domain-containing protein [Desertihabitans brevis]